MADEWHYACGDTQHGPVNTERLKELARAGELSPEDMVWRAGMEDWVPARRLKGLFEEVPVARPAPPAPEPVAQAQPQEQTLAPPPKPSETTGYATARQSVKRPLPRPHDAGGDEEVPLLERVPAAETIPVLECAPNLDVPRHAPPPLPLPPGSPPDLAIQVTDRLANEFSELGGNIRAAASLTARQVERTKLTATALPNAYQALGRWCFDANTHGSEFPDAWQRVSTLRAEIHRIEREAASLPPPIGLAEKAKAAARAAKDAVHAKALKHSLGQAHAALGRVVFETHGIQSGPDELARPIAETLARLATVDAEIRHLSQANPGVIFTPKCLIIGAAIAAGALLLLFVFYLMFGGRH